VKAAMVNRKIDCYTSTPGKQLVTDNGAVVGVLAERDGRDFWVRARKGVLIATSGYDWNEPLALAFERLPEFHTTTFPGLTGDGLIMAAEIGGMVLAVAQDQALPGYKVPGEEHEGVPLYRFATIELGLPHGIMVNRQGKRFADESFYRAVLAALHDFDGRTQTYKNFPAYLVFDQNYREKYPMGSVSPGMPLPDGMGATAGTLRALAEQLEIDMDVFEETVKRFNEFARQGTDPDFRRGELPWSRFMTGDFHVKPNPNLAPLERPPFYGVRITFTSVGTNNAGLVTDANGQVAHVRGHPIDGLYAAGNAATFLEMRRGYQSGLANTRGMTFGFLAARHAARQAAKG